MSELLVSVDHAAFTKVGLDVSFNSERYLDLLELATGGTGITTYPKVTVLPRYDLGLSWQQRLAVDRQDLDAVIENGRTGHYTPDSNEVVVKIHHTVEHTNNTLRHETKHWADDHAGILFPEMLHALNVDEARNKLINENSVLGTILGHMRYRQLPYERRAREFAADKRVQKLIGNIISY